MSVSPIIQNRVKSNKNKVHSFPVCPQGKVRAKTSQGRASRQYHDSERQQDDGVANDNNNDGEDVWNQICLAPGQALDRFYRIYQLQ